MSEQSPSSSYNVGGFSSHDSQHQQHQQHPQHPQHPSRKRKNEDSLQLDLPSLGQHPDPYGQAAGSVPVHHPAPGYPIAFQPAPPTGALPSSHHHRLPGPPPPKRMATNLEGSPSSPNLPIGPPSMVGKEGMPPAAPRPKGPKLKFTPEDDALLVDLKEKKNLTWKQIADFFPGRSSGTLQVRYCTKLKAKTTNWTDEMVQKLRTAMQEYETDRWRIIASKVGQGFSATACREKASELEAIEQAGGEEEEEEEESGYTQTQLAPGPSDQAATYQ